MEGAYFMIAIIGGELGLVAVVTWFVMQLRGEASEAEARRKLADLEREEEALKKAA